MSLRRTKLHKQSKGGRASWTTVCPEDNVILVRIISALEEVEEEVASLNVDVPRERPVQPPKWSIEMTH